MIDDGAQLGTVLLHILEESVVAPECLAQSPGAFRWRVVLLLPVLADSKCLLPVKPPEIDALLLVRTDDVLEESLHKVVVLHLPQYRFSGRVAQVGSQRAVAVLMGSHAVGGVQVEGGLQAVTVDEVDESPGIGDAAGVPAPARPAALVPVHVHDEHVHRDILALRIAHNLLELRLRVSPIAAVPVAEDVLRRQRHTAAHFDKVAQTFLVLMAVAEEVPIDSALVNGIRPPSDALLLWLKGV